MNSRRSDMGELSVHGTGTSGGYPKGRPRPIAWLTHHSVLCSPIIPVCTLSAQCSVLELTLRLNALVYFKQLSPPKPVL